LRQSVGKVAPYLADRPILEVEPFVAPDTRFNRAECNPDEKTQRREAEDQHWYLAPPSLPGFVVLRCLDGVLWHRVLLDHSGDALGVPGCPNANAFHPRYETAGPHDRSRED